MLQNTIAKPDELSNLDNTHWSESRKSIVQLLQSGFNSDTHSLPLTLRHRVWRLIDAALRDPKPLPADEVAYGPPNMDPFTSAVNFTRGAAMIAAIEYALWVHRNSPNDKDNGRSSPSLDCMPEVRLALERHLQLDLEPSISIRSVYGRYFRQLYWIDSGWCESVVDKIFTIESELTAHGMVAWQSYLVASSPRLKIFRLLEPHYLSSALKLPMPDYAWRHRTPEQALFKHVLLLFINGHLDFNDGTSLVSVIYQNADPGLRKHGNSWLGSGIRDGDISDDMIDRARRLWEWRVAEVQTSSGEDSAVELRSFVWWLRSGRFDVSWVAKNLIIVLSLARQIDNEESVLKWLAKNAAGIPSLSIEAVRLLCVETYREFWVLESWIDDIRTVLRVVLDSADFKATHQARLLVQDLASRGLVSGEEFSVD